MKITAAACALFAVMLAACAPLRDPWGLAIRRGNVPEARPVPESLQVDLGILPREPGALPFSARLYAKPYRRYRLDAFGFPALIAASYAWRDGRWLLVRHDEKRSWEGTGDELELEGVSLRIPDVHAVLGFLWGQPLPGFVPADSGVVPAADGTVRWTYKGEAWEALFDSSTGLCREARSASLALKYRRYRRLGGRVLPEEVEVLQEGKPLLSLSLRGADFSPAWKKDPFILRIPASYGRSETSSGE